MFFAELVLVIGVGVFSPGSAFALAKKAPTSASNGERVWVKKHDGSVACEDPATAVTAEAGQGSLEKAGVKVFESRKQSDGRMRAAVCGIPTGKENAYLIPKSDLVKAQKQGFAPEEPTLEQR